MSRAREEWLRDSSISILEARVLDERRSTKWRAASVGAAGERCRMSVRSEETKTLVAALRDRIDRR